jgi:hypothetical protein
VTGFVKLGITLGQAFNSAMEAFSREQDRAAGRNEAEVVTLREKERVRREAKDTWDSPSRGRIKRGITRDDQ